VRWGKAKAAARFRVLVLGAYVVLVAGVVTGFVTPVALISLLALPKAWAATRVLSREHDKVMELIPGMANMVMATLWTGLLLLAGYVIMGLFF
jgi:1,4-dihydroxy-2-naphthoate octaprenyltransferase